MSNRTRKRKRLILEVCIVLLALPALASQAQQEPSAPSSPRASAASPNPVATAAANNPKVDSSPDQDKTLPQSETLAQRQHDAQIQERKNQLAVDTAKLLQLANELKTEMDKSSKDMLSVAVIKKADEVEKLAHKVRDEMKASIGN